MPTPKYDALSPQNKCLVDASVSEISRVSQEFNGPHFNKKELALLKESASEPDTVKEVEGFAREGKAPWAKCFPKP